MPVQNEKLEVSLEGLVGPGIGRYGTSGLPDATLDPITGALRPLRQGMIMGGVVYHGSSRLDMYVYGGDEYVGRDALRSEERRVGDESSGRSDAEQKAE